MFYGQVGGHAGNLRFWNPPGSPSGPSHSTEVGTATQLKACMYYPHLWETDTAVHTTAGGCGANGALASDLRSSCCLCSPPPEPTPASPVQGRPGAAGVWGPPPSPPGLPPLSVCHCPAQRPPAHSFAQGLLRGLNPGPGGQQSWAGDIPVAHLPWITCPVQLASYGGPGHAIFSVMG